MNSAGFKGPDCCSLLTRCIWTDKTSLQASAHNRKHPPVFALCMLRIRNEPALCLRQVPVSQVPVCPKRTGESICSVSLSDETTKQIGVLGIPGRTGSDCVCGRRSRRCCWLPSIIKIAQPQAEQLNSIKSGSAACLLWSTLFGSV